ncbi:uncharacterized protein LOC117250729 [Epinephelus lanceolatus]
MDGSTNVSCELCRRSEETKITGPLSTKDEVTAHQNCLLFSSGIICQSTPQHDDLFGFSVEDVLCEVQRGKRLVCKRCTKSGATAGCEVKRCKKSYHYPCAVEDKAIIIEDTKEEKYVLYCPKHDPKAQENNGSVNGRPSSHTKSWTSKTPSEPRSDKKNSIGCAKAPRPLSAYSSDSSSSNNATPSSSKRRCEPSDKHRQDETPSKRKFKSPRVIQTDDSSDSDDSIPDSDMAIFAPLETDLESCVNSVYEPELISLWFQRSFVLDCIEMFSFSFVWSLCKNEVEDNYLMMFSTYRKDTESPVLYISESQPEEERGDGSEDETMIHSDAESQSLLSPVPQRRPTTVDTISTETSPAGPPPSRDHSKPRSVTASPPCTTSATSPAPPETVHVTVMLPPSPSPPPPPFPPPSPPSPPYPSMGPPSDPEPTINATSFWRSCITAGCTQAIFTGFINEMNDIFSRIQSDQASQEDYDLALSVMTVSGKLAELVAKQQEETRRKQVELQKVAAVMEKVISTLRGVHQQLQ